MPARRDDEGEHEALRRIEAAAHSNASKLDISSLGLTAIPDTLARLANLQTLYLFDNQITAIPDTLARLADLQNIRLFNNQITAIPDSLTRLANLRILGLSNNQIIAIPDSLTRLANLQNLYLSSNQITTIPDSLVHLAHLQNLNISSNQITVIPDSLARLASLQTLDLSDNQITTIPDSLARLASLQTLDLRNNQITAIPDSLVGLANLTALFLHGNQGLGIPDEILGSEYKRSAKSPKVILHYYSSQRADSRPLNEAKLILVGLGGVGKTSLVKALITGRFKRGEKTTEGIKISEWSCFLTKKDKVKLHIWDFGGQEMMHATHQFFLTARSLYLLVLNRRQGGLDREVDYWFRLIRAFGGKAAPVIVVLNKQKIEPFDVNRGGWLEKYAENIRGFVATDCSDTKTIIQLERKIQEQLQKMTSLKAGFPGRWFAIKDELAQMERPYVSFENYRELCRRHGENDPGSQTSLAGFLHDLGIALNYKDLHFAYVLKPEWVTGGIYALLHAFVTRKGLFSRGEAEKTLEGKRYPAEATDFILGLMEKFDLSFPLGDPQKRILIPQLLDDQQPDLARDFRLSECLNYGYQYPIVPEGLLPRFIVRTYHLSDPPTRWKSGVILQHRSTGCRALVRADYTESQVRIHIDGPETSRPELLAIIRYNFEVIHADHEFKPADLIYPPGVPEKALHLDELQTILRNGTLKIPVMLADKTVITPGIASLVEPVQAAPSPLRLFLSYAHKDEKYVDELRKVLKLMERNGLIRTWYDRALTAGEKWEVRILQELNEADAVICQLSRDFLASDFCVLTELETAIQRKAAGEVELIAYVLKECGWRKVPKLKEFQILPKDAKPVVDWKDKNKYWQAVANGIQNALKKLQDQRLSRPSKDRLSSATVGEL